MGTYDRQVATAQRLIAAKGVRMNWCRLGAPIMPDPDKPWITENNPGSPVIGVASLVFVPESDVRRYMSGFGIERSEVPTGGLFALMGEVPFTPMLKDWITFEATPTIQYATLSDPITSLAPALDQNVLWILRFAQ